MAAQLGADLYRYAASLCRLISPISRRRFIEPSRRG
jgi:hypothetical protein